MNYWIFQAVLERYNLPEELRTRKEQVVTWYATRYRSHMAPGDLVYFWLGGDRSIKGIYGWGTLASAPYVKPSWETYGVDVEYEMIFSQEGSPYHVKIQEIEAEPALQNLLILRAPMATNFLISREEAQAIAALIPNPAERPTGV